MIAGRSGSPGTWRSPTARRSAPSRAFTAPSPSPPGVLRQPCLPQREAFRIQGRSRQLPDTLAECGSLEEIAELEAQLARRARRELTRGM